MKLRKFIVPLLMVSFAITSCGTEPAPDTEEIDTTFYFIFGNNMDTKAHFTYSNDYFRQPATKFNSDFALMSFVATANSGQKAEMKKFYDAIHFSNHYYTEVYDKGSGEDTYGFYMADRVIDDFTLVALSFRSYDYTQEWVSNVHLGKEGNHAGFEYAVNNALVEFNDYMAKHYQGKNIKLWVNGFSRGGAEANMFSSLLLSEGNDYGLTEDNLYCYTFEAPACFSEENYHPEYKNIINMSNSGDVVVNVPPKDYGLYRSGRDVDILRDDFDELFAEYMYEIYPDLIPEKNDEGETVMVDKAKEYIDIIPSFVTSNKYKNETEFMKVLVDRILKTDDPNYGIQDREHYVEHLEPAAMFLTKLFYSMDQIAMYYVMNDFQRKYLDTPNHMLKLAALVLTEGGLYELVSPYLKYVQYEYEDEDLQKTCDILYNILLYFDIGDVLSIVGALSNIQRALYFHWHESSYVLIRAFDGDPDANI